MAAEASWPSMVRRVSSPVPLVKRISICSARASVDFFLEEKTNRVIFNEINTLPGFTSISMYPMLFRAAGIDTEELVDKLIELALTRNEE